MTHTLHRTGLPIGPKKDFVVFAISAKTVNSKGSATKMKKFVKIAEKYHHNNFGDMKTGSIYSISRDKIHDNVQDTSIVHFVYTDREVVKQVIQEVREANLGISVVISGQIDEIDSILNEAGLSMHTVEYSGSIYGKTELLPSELVLGVTTMCGHGMIANALVVEMVKKVENGKKTLEEAAKELAKSCQCGVFNTDRAKR